MKPFRLLGIITAAAILLSAAALPANGQIAWRGGASERSTTNHADVIATLVEHAQRDSTSRVVVQFDTPVTPDLRTRLQDAGLTLESYLGNNAFFAHAGPTGIHRPALEATPSLIDVQPIQADWKLHPVLARGETPEWAVVRAPDVAEDADTIDTWIAAYVLFHDQVDQDQVVVDLESMDALVLRQLKTVNGMVIELPLAQVDILASHDAVMYVEPALPPLREANAENRALTGADTVQAAPYNLDGSGVTVMVYDGGAVSTTHADFGGRVTIMDGASPGMHATHVGGIIAGDGTASGGLYAGMAPGATVLSYSSESVLPQGLPFYTDPGDIEDDFADAIANGADVGNASLALNISINADAFGCAMMGDYSVVSGVIDSVVRGGLGVPFRSIWGAGNERTYAACGDTYATIPPPHAAKNHIAVGGVNANDDSMTTFSSWGPVDDGRIKPDIVAPGCQVGGDYGVTSTYAYDDNGYVTICGTSMAAPTVAGLAALLIEDFRAQYPDRPLFRNSTLKAVLAHTAADGGNTGPDYQYGYGSVRIQPAVDLMRGGAFWEDSLTQGGIFTRTVTVDPGDPELKVTLAWDDYPGTPNVVLSLVNDLDLIVTSPSAVRHYPWTLEPANPGVPAVQTVEDHLNNIEQVLVESPEAGTWTVEVYGLSVPEGPQPFSLVGDGASQAGLAIDFPAGVPETIPPGIPETIEIQIVAAAESIVPNSATLHYRSDGGSFQTLALLSVGGDLYEATLPAFSCGDVPEFYVSVEGSVSGLVRLPGDAPTSAFAAEVGVMTVIFEDDFETDQGWTTGDNGATAGFWERGVPVPNPVWNTTPEEDADGSGQCYLTDNRAGLYDVDGGGVILTSPALDMAGSASEFSFAYYLNTNDYTNFEDTITVEVSANGAAGPWFEVFRYHLPTHPYWHWGTITSNQMSAAGATPSANTQIRFLTTDDGAMSTVEGGIDAVTVSAVRCLVSTCDDAILNQGEERIDCGGPCPACDCTSHAVCDNATFCDGPETCNAYGQCAAGMVPCTAGEWCNETATTCAAHGDGDFDGDLDVDLLDFRDFQICYGFSAEFISACEAGNLTGTDGSVDLADYTLFAAELDASGP